jgi:hypothetical protein
MVTAAIFVRPLSTCSPYAGRSNQQRRAFANQLIRNKGGQYHGAPALPYHLSRML